MSAETFTYRWGPDALVGLGVRLQPDQAAVTETTGYALTAVTLGDPLDECGGCPQYGEDGNPVVVPMIQKVTLNDLAGPNWFQPDTRYQDVIDEDHGTEWRHMAKSVGDHHAGIPEWAVRTEKGYSLECHIIPVWDAIMLDASDAQRMDQQIQAGWNAASYDQLSAFKDLCDTYYYHGGFPCPEDENEFLRLCETFGVDLATEPGEGSIDEDLVKYDLHFPFDSDLQRLWTGLLTSSRRHWAAIESVQAKGNTAVWRHNEGAISPWW